VTTPNLPLDEAGAPSPPDGGGVRRHPSGGPGGTAKWRRNRLGLLAGLAVVLSAVSALFAFGLRHDPAATRSPVVGRLAPDFRLPTLDGSRSVSLSGLRGQVVVLNFWASWCAECRLEHPNLEAAWQHYQDQGVVFVGIPFNDSVSASKGYARELGGGWPLVQDPGSRTALAYGITGVPETFFIGSDGKVQARLIGPVRYDVLTDHINALLEARAR
jgi:cytochrome c biogenesis protein CcmG, thiol:disulfide interchange protein DsbE